AGTGRPVPYVNIGIPGQSMGTVADERGRYQLSYAAANLTDTVRLSSIGYEPQRILLQELVAGPNVALVPAAVQLADVRVQAPSLFKRTLTLGCTTESKVVMFGLQAKDRGAEMGTVISLRRQPTKVQKATFNLLYKDSASLTFRVNLYRLLPNGQPSAEKLNHRDILVTSASRPNNTGPLVVDLMADALVLEEDFFLAIEWVAGGDTKQVNQGLAFSAALGYFGDPIYARKVSQGAWKKVSLGARLAGMQPKVSFYVTALD
ncbi:carboxypeptidase-like regulatory domain-containing protein, partial [Hymenobacter lapidiphilus]